MTDRKAEVAAWPSGVAMRATSRRVGRRGVLGRSPSGRGPRFLLRIRGAGWRGSQAAASSLETYSVPPRITEAGGLYGQN